MNNKIGNDSVQQNRNDISESQAWHRFQPIGTTMPNKRYEKFVNAVVSLLTLPDPLETNQNLHNPNH